MMDSLDFSGQTLDGKYLVERELGRGGMGTVYLATHLGTERPVAVKIIAPQFMQRAEFVERFRREARAAGRLRHPNVVDVTDFGFADTPLGEVAYLIMEYLDGCTLGEVLDEEERLPVAWTLDILEQVCSAVGEAHHQGIIHRDLKPDNIWLEPNQRGGYTVKVLDFGIAKLEETVPVSTNGELPQQYRRSKHTMVGSANTTFGGSDETLADRDGGTRAGEGATLVQSAKPGATFVSEGRTIQLDAFEPEGKTAIYSDGDISSEAAVPSNEDTVGTKLISEGELPVRETPAARSTTHSLRDSRNSAELTRVGAVLGTPLYMSPEQCRGEHLDQRSDIYSLGIIAYQMLSGSPPFTGDFKEVMEQHKSVKPRPLSAKGVRRKMARSIDQALDKDPEKRPQSAEAFASVLRSRSEGIWALLRRAMVIYSEHLPAFVGVTALFSIPVILLTLLQTLMAFLRVSGQVSEAAGKAGVILAIALLSIASAFCASLAVGAIVWIVAQYLSVPLRPLRLRPALKEVRSNWKRVLASGAVAAFSPMIAAVVAGIGVFAWVGLTIKMLSLALAVNLAAPLTAGVIAGCAMIGVFWTVYVWCILVTPVAMMEKLSIRGNFKRSRELTGRAFATSMAAAMIMFIVPMALATGISFFVNVTAKAFDPEPKAPEEAAQVRSDGDTAKTTEIKTDSSGGGFNFSIGRRPQVEVESKPMDMRTKVKRTFLETVIQLFWVPIQIIVLSFSGIIVGLLYLKTRLAGGESGVDLVERFEDDGRPKRKWQERVRERLIQSGRIPSKP